MFCKGFWIANDLDRNRVHSRAPRKNCLCLDLAPAGSPSHWPNEFFVCNSVCFLTSEVVWMVLKVDCLYFWHPLHYFGVQPWSTIAQKPPDVQSWRRMHQKPPCVTSGVEVLPFLLRKDGVTHVMMLFVNTGWRSRSRKHKIFFYNASIFLCERSDFFKINVLQPYKNCWHFFSSLLGPIFHFW